MTTYLLFSLILFITFYNAAEGIMCHRCFSAMGGCGNDLNWRMFPWRDCGDSDFCVKVIQKVGSEYSIIRDCENELMKSTRHRLQMPNLRRHGYCLPARKNDASNPLNLFNQNIQYCFCNDWNGCNSASGLFAKFAPLTFLSAAITFLVGRLL